MLRSFLRLQRLRIFVLSALSSFLAVTASSASDFAPEQVVRLYVLLNVTSATFEEDLGAGTVNISADDFFGAYAFYTKLSPNTAQFEYYDIGYGGTATITFTSARSGTFHEDYVTWFDKGFIAGTFQILEWDPFFAENKWFSNSDYFGDGWHWLPWFGSFNANFAPWLFHAKHGWLFAVGDDQDSLYLWDGAMNSFLWTSSSIYPSMYRFSDGRWIFYQKGTQNPRNFVDLLTGLWEQW